MANYDIVAFELVNQVRSMDDADEEDWVNLFKYNVLEIIPLKDWYFLPMRGQLALASTIVGTRSVAHFDLAFRIMCDWSIVGGCYWVAQLELIRLYCLHTISMQLEGPHQKHLDPAPLKVSILNILPVEPHGHNTHVFLRKKMALLRSEMFWLLDEMADSSHPYDVFVEYHAPFQLCCYVPWFLSWTLRLLVETEDCFEPLGASVAALLRRQGVKRVRKTHISETKCGEGGEWDEDLCDGGYDNSVISDSDAGEIDADDSESMYSACRNDVIDAPVRSIMSNMCNAITTLACVPENSHISTSSNDAKRKCSESDLGASSVTGVGVLKKQRTGNTGADAATDSDKENLPAATNTAILLPQAIPTITTNTTTPDRLPFRDLRIVTDPAKLRYLEQLHHSRGGGSGGNSHSGMIGGSGGGSGVGSGGGGAGTQYSSNIADDYNSSYYANPAPHGTTNLTAHYPTTERIITDTDTYSFYTNATHPDYANPLLDELHSHTHTDSHSSSPVSTSSGTSTTMNTNTTSNHTVANPTEYTHTHSTTTTSNPDNTDTHITPNTSTGTSMLQQLVHSVWEVFSPNNQEPNTAVDTANTTTTNTATTNTDNTIDTTDPNNDGTTLTNRKTLVSGTSRGSTYKGSSMGSLAYSDTTDNSLPVRV